MRAWLAARSLSRNLPAPLPDHGGWRVDSNEPEERRRYVFAHPGKGLRVLGESIDEPFVALKLCRSGPELMALLPARWQLASDHFMMVWDRPEGGGGPAPGYRLSLHQEGAVSIATIEAADGEVAASGRAAYTDGVFAFDQIRTEEAHRRRGLATAIIHALRSVAQLDARLVLTATHDGRALYRALGWRDYCPYATALIPPPRY